MDKYSNGLQPIDLRNKRLKPLGIMLKFLLPIVFITLSKKYWFRAMYKSK